MISENLHSRISHYVKILQRFTDRFWYPPLIGILAALDNLIIVIPNDGILISSSMLIPKRWIYLAFSVAIGSTIGAILLAGIVEFQGLPWILGIYPGLDETSTWTWTVEFFQKYGLFFVFAVAILPIVQQPAVILASIADTPIFQLALVIFVGRLLKFLFMAYVASHAPKLITRIWGMKNELQDVGIDANKIEETENKRIC